ncbi:hypothetical protein HL666_20040 [Bradyrhizobium sp. 83002]|uniref:hypothetical protein n=1 Tax=Bradyrhizobium aeschynomenes TaxID=2734909 RepID=UPI00155212B7|nr:hypothetical protein [Bradyrhizobium aeschynomenes]NPU13064.1 hypothetical protein [Bradyrhizobium aeschynomenes]
MPLRIYPNHERGPGYAWIEIEAALPTGVVFTISAPNRVNKNYLGAIGWQAAPYEWKPIELSGTILGSRMLVGPSVVDHIWEDELLELRIPLAGYSGQTTWPDDVSPSGVARPINPVSDDPLHLPVVTVDDPSPKPPLPATGEFPEANKVVELDQGQASPSPGPEVTSHLSPFKRLGIVLWAIAGLAIGYGIGYAYMSPSSLSAPAAFVDNIASDVAEAQRLLPGTAEKAEQIYQVGLRLRTSRAPGRELGLQALHRAAELNFVPALLWFGKTADPIRDAWQGVRLSPDVALALDSYGRAERANSAEARQLKAALCRHIQADATLSASNRGAASNGCT